MSIQTFPDPDLDRRAGYKSSPEAFHYAVELTLGLLDHLKVGSLEEVKGLAPDPDHEMAAEMALHVAGVHLTREQRGILSAHADKLAYIRRAITSTKTRAGRKRLVVCVCLECGGWALLSQGSPGPCPVGGHKLFAPKSLPLLNPPATTSQRRSTAKTKAAKTTGTVEDPQAGLFGGSQGTATPPSVEAVSVEAVSVEAVSATHERGKLDLPNEEPQTYEGPIDDVPPPFEDVRDIDVEDLPDYTPIRTPFDACDDDPSLWAPNEPPATHT